MNFMLEWQEQYLMSERSEPVRINAHAKRA